MVVAPGLLWGAELEGGGRAEDWMMAGGTLVEGLVVVGVATVLVGVAMLEVEWGGGAEGRMLNSMRSPLSDAPPLSPCPGR